MAEYFEREATIKRIEEAYCADCNSYNGVRCRACGTGDAIDMIEDAPAADVAPVVHGRWEPHDRVFGDNFLVCSKCQFVSEDKATRRYYHYCPNCGAKMDGGNENV